MLELGEDLSIGFTLNRHAMVFGKASNERFSDTAVIEENGHGQRSRDCSHSLGTPLVATNEGDLNKNDRAGCGNRRKNVFAKALMPKFVHGQTETDEYKTPDIKTELEYHRAQADI